jgi:hypothetical protein
MIGRVAVIFSAVLIVACTPARIASLDPPKESEQSELMVYRATALNAGGLKAIFGADGKDYLELGTDTYAELLLVPKTYDFFVRTNQADRRYVFKLELKPNERKCLEAYPNPDNSMKVPLLFVGYWLGSTFLLKEVECPSSQSTESYQRVARDY